MSLAISCRYHPEAPEYKPAGGYAKWPPSCWVFVWKTWFRHWAIRRSIRRDRVHPKPRWHFNGHPKTLKLISNRASLGFRWVSHPAPDWTSWGDCGSQAACAEKSIEGAHKQQGQKKLRNPQHVRLHDGFILLYSDSIGLSTFAVPCNILWSSARKKCCRHAVCSVSKGGLGRS